ncbi:glycosyltransferase [Paenibacillus oralis]|uniref:Glycosyltransferase n=1 Tax=Paenibacillus oralis TaxID=2490856 RepID=A0A3P3UAZ7_9BACL|nr:glycosyltransferase [Paenibacillus oralis]RRJ66778.1 glycosyltransferase [Paenibacillus oralis]
MITISLCMIVRDEEHNLPNCLASVQGIADEIVIVDTGSVDRTKEIAKDAGAAVYDFVWTDNFSAARNYSFSKATQEYILWLDADDLILEEDRKRFKQLKTTLSPQFNTVTMPYNLAFDNEGQVVFTLRRNRLVRRDCGFEWIGHVHEYLAVWGTFYCSGVCITHGKTKPHTDRNLRIYRKLASEGAVFSPRDLYYYANELRDHGFYGEACRHYEQFLHTGQGWAHDNYQACLKLADCYERLGNEERAFRSLCRTLQYDKPQAEFCYRMGLHLFAKQRYDQAIYWYKQAIYLPESAESMGLRNTAVSTWMPHLQLALCYDRKGDYRKGNYHNELALHYNPSHPSMLYNRNYFKSVLGAQNAEFNREKKNL